MNKRPFAAEIVGPAAAGKSTLSRVLCQRDSSIQAGLSIWGLPLPWLATSFFTSLPSIVVLYRSCHWFRSEQIKHVVRLEALYLYLRSRSSSNVAAYFLDEGALFTLAKLCLSNPSNLEYSKSVQFESWVQRILKKWAKTLDVVIWLDAPNQILIQRLRARSKHHRMKDKSDQEIYEFLLRYRLSYEQVIAELMAHDGPRVVRFINDTESMDYIACEVLSATRG